VLLNIIRTVVFILLTLVSYQLRAQDTSDVQRLREMHYMSLAGDIDCDNTTGTNIEHRICLNLEFQKLDSIMNMTFLKLLARTDNDSIKVKLRENQLSIVNNRRLQSEIISDGYTGHTLGIIYLNCMVESTRSRISELEKILE